MLRCMLVCMGFYTHAGSIVGNLAPGACIDYENETRTLGLSILSFNVLVRASSFARSTLCFAVVNRLDVFSDMF